MRAELPLPLIELPQDVRPPLRAGETVDSWRSPREALAAPAPATAGAAEARR